MNNEWICELAASGELPKHVLRELAEALKAFAGKKIRLKLSAYRKQRSSNQNKFYWGCVVPAVTQMFREHGNNVDEDDVHELLKLRVGKLAQVFVKPDGEVVKGLGSTKKLTTMEFEVYLEKIRAWAAEYGCQIPLPNES